MKLSSIHAQYPLEASSTFQPVVMTKMSTDIAEYPWPGWDRSGNITLGWEPVSK